MIANVDVLTPPPVEQDDAPIIINKIIIKYVAGCVANSAQLNVVNPAVLHVTDVNKDCKTVKSGSVNLINNVPIDTNKIVIVKVIFVCNDNFFHLLFLNTSSITMKPIPPNTIITIVVTFKMILSA